MIFKVLFVAGALILLYSLYSLFAGRGKATSGVPSGERVNVPLEELAQIWLRFCSEPAQQTEFTTAGAEPQATPAAGATQEPVKLVDDVTRSFVETYVAPHSREISEQGAKEIIEELLQLLNTSGKCPSVVLTGSDREAMSLLSVKDSLARVPLREHTFHVAGKLVELVNKSFMEPRNLIPEALVAALSHDVGKIPEFLTGQYNTQEHPMISEIKLAEIMDRTGKHPAWADHVRKVVREHHLPGGTDQLGLLLKEADRTARMLELAGLFADYSMKEFSEWFDPVEFVKELVPHINVVQTNRWQAISHRGIVYVRPDFLYHIANEMRHRAKVLDSLFVYSGDTEAALRNIVSALRKIEVVAPSPFLKEGAVSRKFKLVTPSTRVTGKTTPQVLTPLRLDRIAEISGVPVSEIERRKQGLIETLEVELD